MNSKQPLEVTIKDGRLSISIGVETLAFAINNDGKFYGYNITNAAKFAEDVLDELLDEQEDGTTLVHLLLDNAADIAINNGSEWCEERVCED